MKKILFVIAVLVFSVSVFAFNITQNGKAKACIVVGKNATESEKFAAEEFAKYIKEISGDTLLIQNNPSEKEYNIYIGKEAFNFVNKNYDFSKLKNDGIIIKSTDKYLALCGENDRGVLYSVYTFLEDYCGVRYIMPDDEFIPKKKTVSCPKINIEYSSPFMIREVFGFVNNENPLFDVKQKLNGIFPKISNEMGGHYLIGRNTGEFVHTFRIYISPDKYGKDHPEWFSEIEGVRKPSQGTQLCLANEELQNELVKNVLEYIENYPQCQVYSLSQNDNQLYCQCDKCKEEAQKYGQTGLLLKVVNKVADAVKEKYPNKYIETLAYHYTRELPKGGIVPRDNVIVRLCSAECDFSKPFDAETNKTFYDDLVGWGKLGCHLAVWDYHHNYNNYYIVQPNLQVQKKNIQLMKENNVYCIFSQGYHNNSYGPLFNIKRNLIGKLLWNPNINAEKVINEYVDLYYGPAGSEIKKYLKLIEQGVTRDPETFLNWGMHDTSYFSVLDYVKGFEILQKAVKKAQGTKYEIPVMCELMCFHKGFVAEKKVKQNEVKAKIDLLYPDNMDFALAFEKFIKENNMPYYSEGTTYENSDYVPQNIKPQGQKPEICENLNDDEWLDLQEDNLKIVRFFDDTYSHAVKDETASNGETVWMNPEYKTWFVQKYLPFMYLYDHKSADVFITYKIEKKDKTKNTNHELLMDIGIYNITEKNYPVKFDLFAEETGKYITKKMGTLDLENTTDQTYLYFCGMGDKDYDVFVDRVFFVFDK